MAGLANAQRNRAADAVLARLNSGFLRIYNGTRPATADTALSGNTLLATLPFGATAFSGASAGVANANAITSDTNAAATGRPSFARLVESNANSNATVMDYWCAFAWIASTAYAVGDNVVNAGNQYRCTVAGTSASSGGPTGTGGSITDGGVTWTYVAAAEITLTSGPNIQAAGTVSLTSLSYTQGAS